MSPESALKAQKLADQLEQLVDKTSLVQVLDALSLVCSEKADRMRDHWQDDGADYWDRAVSVLLKAADAKSVKAVKAVS